MRVDLSDLAPGEHLRAPFDERLSLQVEGQSAEVEARGEVEILRTGQGARLWARVEVEVPLVCSRCLLPFRETIRANLHEEFSSQLGPSAEGGLGPQDFISWVGPEQQLDVTDVVRQHLQIAVPMAPLHQPDCRGLCPVCGTNWNGTLCAHVGERSEKR